MLGEAGTDNSDVSYTGDVSTSTLSMDYVRQKARECQVLLQSLDTTYQAAQSAIDSGALDDATVFDLQDSLAEFDSRRFILKTTAEGFNAAASIINGVGGRVPVLSIPQTLGLGPLILPLGITAIISGFAVVAAWGIAWIAGVNERMSRAQILENASPEQKAAIVESMNAIDVATKHADNSPIASLVSMIKWGAIGVALFMAYRVATKG